MKELPVLIGGGCLAAVIVFGENRSQAMTLLYAFGAAILAAIAMVGFAWIRERYTGYSALMEWLRGDVGMPSERRIKREFGLTHPKYRPHPSRFAAHASQRQEEHDCHFVSEVG